MPEKIRWGILGPGRIAEKFARGVKAIPDAEITAVGSRNRERAVAYAEQFDIPHRYGHYAELADNPEVDVIYVATPHPFHKACAMLCLEAGKAVLCEKPMTVDAGQAADLIACARVHRRFLMEAMWTRFLPAMVQVADWIAKGAIGEPRLLTADKASRQPLNPETRTGRLFNPALGGGALLDVGVYTVSLAYRVFGPPAEIRSLAHIGETQVDEQTSILLGYDAGQLANLFCAIRTESDNSARIIGTEGAIHIPEFWQATAATLVRLGRDPIHVEAPFKATGLEYQAIEVMARLREGRLESDVMPLAESLSIMNTLDTIRSQCGLVYPEFGDDAVSCPPDKGGRGVRFPTSSVSNMS